jgi:Tfp pilus assembly protein PilN
MFTIDLLKGQGIPIKSGPAGLAVAATTVAVPVIAAIVVFGCYLSNATIISIKKQAITSYKAKISTLSDTVNTHKSLEQEKSLYVNCLSEVKSSIINQFQWSGILTAVVENLPAVVVLTKLEVTQQHIKRKVPKKDDPKTTIDISVPVKTLKINVAASPGSNCDEAVKDFRNRLLSSPSLQQIVKSINVSQTSGTLLDRDVVCYEIDCIFNPPL